LDVLLRGTGEGKERRKKGKVSTDTCWESDGRARQAVQAGKFAQEGRRREKTARGGKRGRREKGKTHIERRIIPLRILRKLLPLVLFPLLFLCGTCFLILICRQFPTREVAERFGVERGESTAGEVEEGGDVLYQSSWISSRRKEREGEERKRDEHPRLPSTRQCASLRASSATILAPPDAPRPHAQTGRGPSSFRGVLEVEEAREGGGRMRGRAEQGELRGACAVSERM
jgi:hypothetical protein